MPFFASQCCKRVDRHSPDLVCKECKGGLHHFRRICCEKGKWFNNSINPKCNLKHAINTPLKCIESIKITQKASKRLRNSRDYCQHKYQQLLNQTGIEISEEQSDFIFNSKTRKDMLDYFQDEATQTITQSELIKYLAISTWDNAAKKKKSGKRSVRYCPIMIRFASYLKNKAGNAAYSFISEVFTLPAIRTLNEYDTLDGNAEDVFLHEMVKDVEETFNSWEIEGEEKIHLWRRTGILKFDEMSIKEKIVYNRHTNEIIGFVEGGLDEDVLQSEFDALATSGEDENNDGDTLPSIAKHILVFILRLWDSKGNSLKICVARYSVSSSNGEDLKRKISEVIWALPARGFIVNQVASDGATENVSAMNQLASITAKEAFPDADIPKSLENIGVAFKHPVYTTVMIYIGGEMPHWIKKFVNAMESSSSPKSKRDMKYKGASINLKMIETVWGATRTNINQLRSDKLTKQHFAKNAHSQMRVHLAVQLVSQSLQYDL